jgi:putative endonuclease
VPRAARRDVPRRTDPAREARADATTPLRTVVVATAEPWAVYLLACAGNRSYVGISPRPDERYVAHVAGRGGAFTRANPPERCVQVVWCDGRRAAASLEARLKATTRARKWRWFASFPDTTPSHVVTLEQGLARLLVQRAPACADVTAT